MRTNMIVLFILGMILGTEGYRSGIDYYGAGKIETEYLDPTSTSNARGIYVFTYEARSLTLRYNIITTLPNVGEVNLHGPARCADKTGRVYSQGSQECAMNTGPVVSRLGKGIVPKEGEDLSFQMFSGSLRFGNVEEDMLFSSEMYVVVSRQVLNENNKYIDDPFMRGQLFVADHTTNRFTSILEFAPFDSSYTPYPTSNKPSRSKNTGIGIVVVNTDSLQMSFTAFTTIPGSPSYFMKCNERQILLSANQNPAEKTVTFEDTQASMLLDYLMGECYFFIISAEHQDGDLFARAKTVGMLKAIGLGSKQDPPVVSAYLFFSSITFDRGMKVMDIVVRHNLTDGSITAAHIHQASDNSVVCNLASNGNPLPGRSFCSLNESHIDVLENGGLYLNIHTNDNPSGELRGDIEFMGRATSFDGTTKLGATTTLALGIGLGVGIPVLLLAIVGIVFLVMKGGRDSKI